MSVALDIVRTYRAPREVLRRRIGASEREDRALAILMGACFLIFIAQWPRLSREAFVSDAVALDGLMAGALFGWVIIAPLFFYTVALLVHWILKALGRASTGYMSRVALFWALLAAAPMWLISGLMTGFIGESLGTSMLAVVALGSFVVFWASGVIEIAKRPVPEQE